MTICFLLNRIFLDKARDVFDYSIVALVSSCDHLFLVWEQPIGEHVVVLLLFPEFFLGGQVFFVVLFLFAFLGDEVKVFLPLQFFEILEVRHRLGVRLGQEYGCDLRACGRVPEGQVETVNELDACEYRLSITKLSDTGLSWLAAC